jgi:hypothetical protein
MMAAPMMISGPISPLRRTLTGVSGEVRFDDLSPRCAPTDASVYRVSRLAS